MAVVAGVPMGKAVFEGDWAAAAAALRNKLNATPAIRSLMYFLL
jgi:hypothetical protein